MTTNSKHFPAYCDIEGCGEEASRWIDVSGIEKATDIKDNTFYLCPEHAEILSPEDSMVHILNLDTKSITTLELAVYSCSDDCEVCNP
jgi:hypothetical protein